MDSIKKYEVARILNALKDAHGDEKLAQAANLLAELGIIFDTPQAKTAWRSQ